jgi:hypothetical protein
MNLWDNPVHSGLNTWKSYHGPRLATDAPLMEKMDTLEAVKADWEAKKAFVNTTRVQTLDRFYNRKLNREQYEHSSTWAPHHRDRGEIHDHHKQFDGDVNSIPIKFLKQVLTPAVLEKDKEAIKLITKRIQNEETWKMAWKQMENMRRDDIQSDLAQRRMFNDVLTQMAGQPPRTTDAEHRIPNDCSERVEHLSKPKPKFVDGDITNLADYRGLIHSDNQLALETLFPGKGYKESAEFKERARAMSMPGYPPPQSETPDLSPGKEEQDKGKREAPRVSMQSVPASRPRVSTICTRTHDEMLACYAKEQYLPTQAPPPPDQASTLMKEDWTKTTTQADPNRMTGNFARTKPNDWYGTVKSQEHLPPPLRQFNYPMLAPMAEKTRVETNKKIEARVTRVCEEANEVRELEPDVEALPTGRRKSYFQPTIAKPPVPDKSVKQRPRRNSVCRNAGVSLSARGPSPASQGSPTSSQMALTARGTDQGYSSMTQGFCEPDPSSAAICSDLDAFEAVYEPVARLGNFFSAPHVPRTKASAAAVPEDEPDQPLQATGLMSEDQEAVMTPEADEQAQFAHAEAAEQQ